MGRQGAGGGPVVAGVTAVVTCNNGGGDGPEVARLRRLCVALEQEVAKYRDRHERMAGGVAALFSELNSEEYRCRGDHWSRRLTDEEVAAMAREPHPDDSGLLLVRYDVPPADVRWVMPGQCGDTITIGTEVECDDMGYALSSYPVAGGPCAEALRLDEGYDHPLWAEMSQRKYLRGVLAQQVDWLHGRHLVRDLRSDLVLAGMDIERLRGQLAEARATAATLRGGVAP